MKQTIYCDLFSCRYYEDETCTASELHIHGRICHEYKRSMAKFSEYANDKTKNPNYPDYPDEDIPSALRLR